MTVRTATASARAVPGGYKAIIVRTTTLPSGVVKTSTEVVAPARSYMGGLVGRIFDSREAATAAAQRQLDAWAGRRSDLEAMRDRARAMREEAQ